MNFYPQRAMMCGKEEIEKKFMEKLQGKEKDHLKSSVRKSQQIKVNVTKNPLSKKFVLRTPAVLAVL